MQHPFVPGVGSRSFSSSPLNSLNKYVLRLRIEICLNVNDGPHWPGSRGRELSSSFDFKCTRKSSEVRAAKPSGASYAWSDQDSCTLSHSQRYKIWLSSFSKENSTKRLAILWLQGLDPAAYTTQYRSFWPGKSFDFAPSNEQTLMMDFAIQHLWAWHHLSNLPRVTC